MTNWHTSPRIREKAVPVKLVITDVDGVLTDGGVYYSENGEQLKRFSIRDGMGVERLRDIAGVETGIMTGELSGSVRKRAEKLGITELHLGVKRKAEALERLLTEKGLTPEQIAFIGDDVNDVGALRMAGFSACPADAMPDIAAIADYVCRQDGGRGAFREFAELIIAAQSHAASTNEHRSKQTLVTNNKD